MSNSLTFGFYEEEGFNYCNNSGGSQLDILVHLVPLVQRDLLVLELLVLLVQVVPMELKVLKVHRV